MSSQIPEGSIIITPQEVYAEVRALTKVVGELVAQDKADTTRVDISALQKDVSTLKKVCWLLAGAALGSGPAWAGVLQALRP